VALPKSLVPKEIARILKKEEKKEKKERKKKG
jgi:hypothetical protein